LRNWCISLVLLQKYII